MLTCSTTWPVIGFISYTALRGLTLSMLSTSFTVVLYLLYWYFKACSSVLWLYLLCSLQSSPSYFIEQVDDVLTPYVKEKSANLYKTMYIFEKDSIRYELAVHGSGALYPRVPWAELFINGWPLLQQHLLLAHSFWLLFRLSPPHCSLSFSCGSWIMDPGYSVKDPERISPVAARSRRGCCKKFWIWMLIITVYFALVS